MTMKELTLVKTKIMDSDNVGMGKIGGGARLLPKTLLEGFVIANNSHAGP